jgi:hypothetical protein
MVKVKELIGIRCRPAASLAEAEPMTEKPLAKKPIDVPDTLEG